MAYHVTMKVSYCSAPDHHTICQSNSTKDALFVFGMIHQSRHIYHHSSKVLTHYHSYA